MGGNALKYSFTRRYSKQEFKEVERVLIPKIKKITKKEIQIPRSYSEKDSFGDMDILVAHDGEYRKIIEKVKEEFKPKEFVSSGKRIFSFLYEELQIDLIFINSSLFNMAKVYFDFNDMGMLIGRMVHVIGLKYGFQGLRYFIYSPGYEARLDKVLLTADPKKVFDIIDLDYKQHQKGFANYEEIFEYLATSKYFTVETFDHNLIRSEDRRRDNKRNSWNIFSIWLENNKQRFKKERPKFSYEEKIALINKEFPDIHIEEKIKKQHDHFRQAKELATIFNGYLIMKRYPTLKGKKLGLIINNFKEYIENNYGWKNFILGNKHTPDQIWNEFDNFIKE